MCVATTVRAGATAVLLLVASGCGTQAIPAVHSAVSAKTARPNRGTVTGLAAVCAPSAQRGHGFRLRVYAKRGEKTVARQWVDAGSHDTGGRYSLRLATGTYLISAPASGDPPEVLTVRAGQVATVNFPQRCG